MKPSKYNILLRAPTAGRSFVFNSLSCAVCELPASHLRMLESAQCDRLPALLATQLHRKGMLVSSDADEIGHVVRQIERKRSHNDIRLVVIPTYGCNLRCPYCYEGRVTKGAAASLKGWAEQVVAFAAVRLALPGVAGCTLGFFGGEPLVAAERCLAVAKGISSLIAEREQKFYCTLTTNGSILNRPVEQLLKHVHALQVTLDGTGAEHDSHRHGPGGRGTYESILDFLAAADAAGVGRSTIRFHLHDYTLPYLGKCARDLHRRLGKYASVHFYFAKTETGCYEQIMTCAHDDRRSLEAAKSITNAREVFLNEGWDPQHVMAESLGDEPVRMQISCGMAGSNTFMIDGHRDIYFCPVAVRNQEMLLGRLGSRGARFKKLYGELTIEWKPSARCAKCRALPFCQGGCYAKALLNTGSIREPFCEASRIQLLIRRSCAAYGGIDAEAIEVEDDLRVRTM